MLRTTLRTGPRIPRQTRVYAKVHAQSTALLHNTQSFLRNHSNGAEVFLVGTAHISKQSAEEVREVISTVKPTTIFVELCQQRVERLRDSQTTGSFIEQIMDMFAGARGAPISIAELFMGGFYKYLEAIGFNPGLEFKVAIQEASARKAELVLGDQPVEVTMHKLSEAMTMQEVFSMFMGSKKDMPKELNDLCMNMSGLESIVEGMKKRSVVKQMHDLVEQSNPKLVNILVHERNAFMVEELYQLKGRIVAVVGLGHLDGMERLWNAKQGLV